MSVVWIIVICEVMIDLLSLIGIIMNLPVSVLGLTMLTWGNSAGDFYANPTIAKLGMAQTAVTACFAGPLFDNLIGFGVALVLVSLNKGNIIFSIVSSYELILSGVFLILSTSISILLMLNNKGKITKSHGKVCISLYIVFFTVLTFLFIT
jgi:solute carrier family 24 (sodium/potassium/calcium exchanger), member 6